MTPAHTPPEAVISPRPTNGHLGYRAVYDPFLDPKLEPKMQRKGGKAVYKEIIEKVCDCDTLYTHRWVVLRRKG
jgi:histone-lysine N-methyltransferase SETD1